MDGRPMHDEIDRLALPLPAMSIAILVVGMHGDVLPFISLAKALQAKGHRVRIATHAQHRRLVRGYSVEHFTIGGDPVEMSRWMVESGGTLLGNARHFKPIKLKMISSMICSLWPAVVATDPLDANSRPFVADAIIANPSCLGHVHVAEALGVPLHCMFPQPWVPTKAYPHPMSGLPQNKPGAELNALSYKLFEEAMWLGSRATINSWRQSELRLPVIPLGSLGGDLIEHFKVPFSFMWSPSFVPKPEDMGEHVEVVGAFQSPPSRSATASIAFNPLSPPFTQVSKWLADGAVFIGFGSVVIPDVSALGQTIAEAAKAANTRVLVQSSWAKLTTAELGGGLCHDIGPCLHDWLIPQVSAVVHHGGANTTAAGLRAGKPTFVMPFFGNQFFWGEMVFRAGVGPKPCPIGQLTAEILDVRVARFRATNWRAGYQVRLCSEAMAIAQSGSHNASLSTPLELARLSTRWLGAYRPVRWGVSRLPGLLAGIVAGIVGIFWEVLLLTCDLILVPDTYARRHGVLGCMLGLFLAPFWMVGRLIHAAVLFVDRIGTGAWNGYVLRRDKVHGHLAMRDYMIDPYFSIEARRFLARMKLEAVELELAEQSTASAQRAAAVLDAIELAEAAKRVHAPFAVAPSGHVSTVDGVRALAEAIRSSRGRVSLDLSEAAAVALTQDVLRCGSFCSFSMFCVLLQRSRAAQCRAPESAAAARCRSDRLRSSLLAEGLAEGANEGGGAAM